MESRDQDDRSLRACANLDFQPKSLPSVTEVLSTRDTSRHHSKGAEMGTAHPGPRRWLSLPLPSTKLSLEIVCPSPVIHERDVRVGARACRRETPGWDRTCGPAPKKRPQGSHTSRVAWPEDVAPRHLPLRDVSEVDSGLQAPRWRPTRGSGPPQRRRGGACAWGACAALTAPWPAGGAPRLLLRRRRRARARARGARVVRASVPAARRWAAGGARSSGARAGRPAASRRSGTPGTYRGARPCAGARGCAAWTTG